MRLGAKAGHRHVEHADVELGGGAIAQARAQHHRHPRLTPIIVPRSDRSIKSERTRIHGGDSGYQTLNFRKYGYLNAIG